MIAVMIAAAGLCALACLWVLKPLRTPHAFYGVSILCAVLSLGVYLLLGSPDLPGHTPSAHSQAAADLLQEAKFMAALETNPNDADTMIRLAALRTIQGRDSAETLRLLDRAKALRPTDRRINVIRSMILNPAPELK